MDPAPHSDAGKNESRPLLYSLVFTRAQSLPVWAGKWRAGEMEKGWYWHNFIQIGYVLEGKCAHYIRDKAFPCGRGDIVVIPPYVPHLVSCPEGRLALAEVGFVPGFIRGANEMCESDAFFSELGSSNLFDTQNAGAHPVISLTGKHKILADELFQSLADEYDEHSAGFLLSMRAGIMKLLVLMGRALGDGAAASSGQAVSSYQRETLNRSLEYIGQNYMQHINIDTVSRAAHLSRSHYARLFRQATGRSFVQYVNELRIGKACELLAETSGRVIDICRGAGFNDVTYFNRVFKGMTGLSPGQYRAAKADAPGPGGGGAGET